MSAMEAHNGQYCRNVKGATIQSGAVSPASANVPPRHFCAEMPITQRTLSGSDSRCGFDGSRGLASGVVGWAQQDFGSAGGAAFAAQHEGTSSAMAHVASGVNAGLCGQPQRLARHCSAVPQQHADAARPQGPDAECAEDTGIGTPIVPSTCANSTTAETIRRRWVRQIVFPRRASIG